jgi:DNA polymerase beta
MQEGGGINHNKDITNELYRLANYEKSLGDVHRSTAYLKAANVLSQHNKEIKSGSEAQKLKGIGKSIATKIDQFLETGVIEKLEKMENDPKILGYAIFNDLSGFGPKKAKELVDNKIYSIEQLEKAVKSGKVTLTNSQILGLKYHEDIDKRIPRKEIKKVESVLSKILKKVCPEMNMIIAGSYRRGKPDSGDIDVLLSSECLQTSQEVKKTTVMKDLMDILVDLGIILDIIAISKTKVNAYMILPEKYHEQFGAVVRRIDLLLVPMQEYPYSLLYFTGSKLLNEQMRYEAKQQGLKLNEKGLFRMKDGKETLIPANSEEDIFDLLGFKYLDPKKREIKS